MRIQRSWILSVLPLVALVVASQVRAQNYPYAPGDYQAGAGQGAYSQPPQGYSQPPASHPAMPPGYGAPGAYAGGPMPYGGMPPGMQAGMPPGMYPASYGQADPMAPPMAAPMDAQGYYQPPMGMGAPMEGGWCPACGGYGCQHCMGNSDDFDLRLLSFLLPYSEGGTCTQRWFDLSAEFVLLNREDVGRNQVFTSDGIAGPIVLSSDNLGFNEEPAFRATAAVQLGPGNNLEASYIGSANWAAAASVSDPTDNLFSVFSEFASPAGPFFPAGFAETDAAFFHSIEYSSTFDSVEMNYRQRWVGPNCRLQGSTMIGVRFFKLDEEFVHKTRTTNGQMDYFVGTANNMTGLQIGGDLWASIVPGVRIGGDVKAGLYGNRAEQFTMISATSIAPPLTEEVAREVAALVAEASLAATWRVNQNWTLRAGYQFLYVDGVALAMENFNSGPPFVAGLRTPFINENGNVFYHGFTAGLEWMW